MMKEGEYNKFYFDNLLLKIFFVFSSTAMTGLLLNVGNVIQRIVGLVVSFIILCIITFKYNFLKILLSDMQKKYFLFTGIFAFVCDVYYTTYFYTALITNKIISNNIRLLNIPTEQWVLILKILSTAAGLLAFFGIFVFWHFIIVKSTPKSIEFLKGLDIVEKTYLVISMIILSISIIAIFNQTNIFYSPSMNGQAIKYDVVYTSDTGDQLKTNVYLNINADENDIRQPLFGLYAMPFGMLAMLVSKVLFFIPNLNEILMNIIQIFLLNIALILIARMLKLDKKLKAFFLIFFSVTYPYLLFTLNMEQYIFAFIWMIMFIYSWIESKKGNEILFIGAAGSLLTSVILAPLVTFNSSLKQWTKDVSAVFIKFFIIITIFGQLMVLMNAYKMLSALMVYSGGNLSFSEKLLQYINFISACIIKPNTVITMNTFSGISYQMEQVSKLNIFGLVILVAVVLGFILNYRNRFAQICFAWSVYSFILLCIVGWGTKENGLILYSLYFSWAFISLLFLLLDRLLHKLPKVKLLIFSAAIASMMLINTLGIKDLVEFGFNYYKVVR